MYIYIFVYFWLSIYDVGVIFLFLAASRYFVFLGSAAYILIYLLVCLFVCFFLSFLLFVFLFVFFFIGFKIYLFL